MRSRASKRGFRTVTGALIALAVLFCACPSSVDAGCSHYLVVNAQLSQLANHLDIFEGGSGVIVAHQVPTRPKRCEGAFCSSKPAVPVVVPILMSSAVKGMMTCASDPLASPTTCQLFTYAGRSVRALIEGPSIERPPR